MFEAPSRFLFGAAASRTSCARRQKRGREDIRHSSGLRVTHEYEKSPDTGGKEHFRVTCLPKGFDPGESNRQIQLDSGNQIDMFGHPSLRAGIEPRNARALLVLARYRRSRTGLGLVEH